jgi:hypothetical protein
VRQVKSRDKLMVIRVLSVRQVKSRDKLMVIRVLSVRRSIGGYRALRSQVFDYPAFVGQSIL